jgi:hypothetical protein
LKPVLSLRILAPGATISAPSNLVSVLFLFTVDVCRKIEKTTFLGCEAFSLTSQKDANGHQKEQAQFVDGYLSLLEQP